MEEALSYQLPSPTNTRYRLSSSSESHQSHQDDISPVSTPSLVPEDTLKRLSMDDNHPPLDETLSSTDLRRLTPGVHASLVSEILSLRRDLENKTKDIDHLEQSLHEAQSHNETLTNTVQSSNKDSRSAKRQLQLLEGGNSSVVTELAKERDEALNDVADLRRRLDQSQKRSKNNEEHAEKTQALWDKDRDAWVNEKRGLQTRVQIAEGRLKVVLSEIANAENNIQPYGRNLSPERTYHTRTGSESPGKGRVSLDSPGKNSIAGRRGRRYSANSVGSDHVFDRMSIHSIVTGLPTNLADEMALDEIPEDKIDGEHLESARMSLDALPEEQVRAASSLSMKARKILGLPIDFGETDRREDLDPFKFPQSPIRLQPSANYVDTAIQFSPPPSPLLPQFLNAEKRYSMPLEVLTDGRQSMMSTGTVSSADQVDWRFAPWNAGQVLMVSSSSQTEETLPSPPLTPEKDFYALDTIHENAAESVETTTSGTQTDPVQFKERSWQHLSMNSREIQIPTITIIPPASRSTTPDTSSVALPPRTRNASNQVDLIMLGSYSSSGIQTEPIRVDRRAIAEPLPTQDRSLSQPKTSTQSRIIPPPVIVRRKPPPSSSLTSSQRTNSGVSRILPTDENVSITKDFAVDIPEPDQLNSTSKSTTEELHNGDEVSEDETIPEEDDIFARPTTKFVLKSGKLICQEPGTEDLGELIAANAGEAAALDVLKHSMPPEMRAKLGMNGQTSPRKLTQRSNTGPKRFPPAKSTNMRRTALVSSGSAVHRTTSSQSTTGSFDSVNPPPFPIPLRYSSARITKSEGGGRSSRGSSTASPTKASKHKQRQMLRRSRSGPAIAAPLPEAEEKSPNANRVSQISIVPEMPVFQMPQPAPGFLSQPYEDVREASAPRPTVATGPRRQASHFKSNSNAFAMNQTTVVDAIAQTMVGEWMYKYVRRRKSFGVPERMNEHDPSKNADELSAVINNGGTRHKRWVWLAPYERAVMWSSKQPISGSALMGKSGRKLNIKSVLDVRDDNPMPKNSIAGPHFNRSILIITPHRALKFTAISQERHFVWLTALSFLSHSPLSVAELAPVPPLPDENTMPKSSSASLTGTFRTRPIRDSIRIAKGGQLSNPGSRSATPQECVAEQAGHDQGSMYDGYDPSIEAALPPTIKRFHTRKRSLTAPRAPPSSFRTFSTRDAIPSLPAPRAYANSVFSSAATSDRGVYSPSLGMQSVSSSRRGSEVGTHNRPAMPPHSQSDSNYTMRINAFMDGQDLSGGRYPAINPRPGSSRRKRLSYWGMEGDVYGGRSYSPADSMATSEAMNHVTEMRESLESRDPFKEF